MSSHSRTNAVGLAIGLAGNSRGSSLSGGLRPNPAVERTRRHGPSSSELQWRRAAHLDRWASCASVALYFSPLSIFSRGRNATHCRFPQSA